MHYEIVLLSVELCVCVLQYVSQTMHDEIVLLSVELCVCLLQYVSQTMHDEIVLLSVELCVCLLQYVSQMMHDEIERIRSSIWRKPRAGGGVQHLPSSDLKVNISQCTIGYVLLPT